MKKFRFAAIMLAGFVLALMACEKTASQTAAPATTQQPAGEPASTAPVALTSVAAPAASAGAPATAPQLSTPATINNPDVFVMARLRDPGQFIERLGAWVSQVQPMMNAEMLRNQLMMMGLDLKELPAGENLAAFLLSPATQGEEPVGVGLLPVGSDSNTVAGLRQRLGDNSVTTVGKHTFVGEMPALERARPMGQALIDLGKTPASSDIQVYVNAATLMEKYGAVLNQKIQAAQMFITSMAAQQQQDPAKMMQVQQILQAEMQAALDAFNQAQFLNLGLDLGADRLDLSLTAAGKPGSGLDKALNKPPVSAPEMTAAVMPEAMVRAQMTIRDMKNYIDLTMKYMAQAMGPGKEAGIEKLKADLVGFDKVGVLHYGLAFDLSPEGKLLYEIVAKTDNNKVFMDLVRTKMTEWFKAGVLHDFYKEMGLLIDVTEAPQTRKADGIEIHHFTMNVDVTTATTPQEREKIQKLLGNMEFEMAEVGEFIALTFGEPLEPLAKRIQAKQAGPPLVSKQANPAGGSLYMDFSLTGFFKTMKAVAPPDKAATIPTLPANMPPLTAVGYLTGGTAYGKLSIPQALVKALVPQPGAMPPGAPAGQEPPAQINITPESPSPAPAP